MLAGLNCNSVAASNLAVSNTAYKGCTVYIAHTARITQEKQGFR